MADKTKECPSCAMPVSAHLDVCPICEYEFAESQSSKRGVAAVAILLLLLALFIFLF